MTIIKSKYQQLVANIENLMDVSVLAQAWKKSHNYIRRHNWYSNVLELDVSAFSIKGQLKNMAKEIEENRYEPDLLRLVPAPKNARWDFREQQDIRGISFPKLSDITMSEIDSEPSFNDWVPFSNVNEPLSLKIRPLAHVSIRDQTLSTAVMLCLANAVETAQGELLEDYDNFSKETNSVSYGNRLYCKWFDGSSKRIADFSWGNSRTYSDYFDHYRQFLARPVKVCRAWYDRLPPNQELFIVKLDIKSFFDEIDRKALCRVLKALNEEHHDNYDDVGIHSEDDAQFWKVLEKIMGWKWDKKDEEFKDLINEDNGLPQGLPQGLVAAGFFANAYLIGFDRLMRQATIQSEPIGNDILIIDYCRYVDDLRVVIAAPKAKHGTEYQALSKKISAWIRDVLSRHLDEISADKKLKLNDIKTEIQPYSSTSTQGSLSALMQAMKAGLSSTFDMETLIQSTGGLDGLLWLSEQLECECNKIYKSRLSLATITKPVNDVRDDTVKRFVATRLSKVLRERLAMADRELDSENIIELTDKATSAKEMAHEFETTARKLIKVWSENPSLVLLLRCAMDLFPHPRLLIPVIEALEIKIKGSSDDLECRKQVKVAEYIASDLFRASSVEIGFRSEEEYPEGVDISAYRQILADFAKRILNKYSAPWYLNQQAYFYLSTLGDFSTRLSSKNIPNELQENYKLQRALRYTTVKKEHFIDYLPIALVAQQLAPNSERFSAWFCEHISNLSFGSQKRAVRLMIESSPDLLCSSLSHKTIIKKDWITHVPSTLIELSRLSSNRLTKEKLPENCTLFRAVNSRDNPFSNENSLLCLAHALISYMIHECEQKEFMSRLADGLGIENIKIFCSDWNKLDSLPEKTVFYIETIDLSQGEDYLCLNEAPEWVNPDKQWLYGFGRILRSAVTGEVDFTASRFLLCEDNDRYYGLRSTWFQRRMTIINTGKSLFPEPAPLTPWFSEFLSGLLQWPGTRLRGQLAQEIGKIRSPQKLLELLDRQISHQRALYGIQSNTPIYVVPVSDELLKQRPLRVAVVQTMRPRVDEIDTKDPLHWTLNDIAQHRRHLAEVCNLARTKVKAWASARVKEKLADDDHLVDVILFPELAVHPEHLGFLRRLSDQLKAHIFTGLTFVHSPVADGPVNTGVWLVRIESKDDARRIDYIWQGKKFPMKAEVKMGIKSHRPHLTLLELPIGVGSPTRIAAVICFDATDIALAADLRDRSDVFMVSAMNKDVSTFDNMVGALNFHMYQPVILANSGEFGGSTAQAPFPGHEKMIAHLHGGNQVAVSVFEIEPWHFKSKSKSSVTKDVKSPPAGFEGR